MMGISFGIAVIVALILASTLSLLSALIVYLKLIKPPKRHFSEVLPKLSSLELSELARLTDTQIDHCLATQFTRKERRLAQLRRLRLIWRYLTKLAQNTFLIQQVARYEFLTTDPHTESNTREQLVFLAFHKSTEVRVFIAVARAKIGARIVFHSYAGNMSDTLTVANKQVVQEYSELVEILLALSRTYPGPWNYDNLLSVL